MGRDWQTERNPHMMKIGERVIVSAAVTGDGSYHHGWIADIYEFLRETFFDIRFDTPAADGRSGCVISNPELIRKETAA